MNTYQNGKIYKLINDVDEEIYIGSTIGPLARRKNSHGSKVQTRSAKVYMHFRTIGWSHVSIELLEAYPCANKAELLLRERYWIDTLKPSLNKLTPGRTRNEWNHANYIKNKDTIKQNVKAYYHANIAKVLAYSTTYRNENRDKMHAQQNEKHICNLCGGKYTHCHRKVHEKSIKHMRKVVT